MKLLKLIVAIDHPNIPDGINYRKRIFELLTNKASKQSPPIPPYNESLNVRVQDKKMYFNVSFNKTGVEINQPTNSKLAIHECVSFYKKINNLTQWSELGRIGVRSYWIEEFKGNFNDLIDVYKNRLFANVDLVKNAPDVALALTLKDEARKINYISGPMEKKQIINMFMPQAPFDEKLIPNVSSFVDYDYFLQERLEYSNSYLEKFVNHAVEFGELKALETEKLLFSTI